MNAKTEFHKHFDGETGRDWLLDLVPPAVLRAAMLEKLDDLVERYDDGKVAYIHLDLEEVIERDREQFLDLILERAGHPLGMDVSYDVVGVNEDGTLRVRVAFLVDEEDEAELTEGAS